jgi:hypothetical protein
MLHFLLISSRGLARGVNVIAFRNTALWMAMMTGSFVVPFMMSLPVLSAAITEYKQNNLVNRKCMLPIKISNSADLGDSWKKDTDATLEEINNGSGGRKKGCSSVISIQKFNLRSIVCGRAARFIMGVTYCDENQCDTMTVFSTEEPNGHMIRDAVDLMKDKNHSPKTIKLTCARE